MQANFRIINSETVPNDYIWDKGVPFDTPSNTVPGYSTNNYTSGYAPGLKVYFENLSQISAIVRNISYNWDFGDYYNDTTNFVTTTAKDMVEHTYVMPGKYNVTLNAAETLPTLDTTVANDRYCLGRHKVRWFWDDLTSESLNNITWDETKKIKPGSMSTNRFKPKTWGNEYACLGKYCLAWTWMTLTPNTTQLGAVRWNETQTEGNFEKRWQFQPNDEECDADAAYLPFSTSTTKTFMVEVIEKPPVAGMHSVTQPVTGNAPLTLEFTSKACQTGSFPIDRIDWDFGDGSPVMSITRYTTPTDKNVKKAVPTPFPNDPVDVRNYNVTHTYNFVKRTYPVFYPSLTCYSANTNTYDTCSLVVGPLTVSYEPSSIKIVKNRNTTQGNIYALEVDDNITFITTKPSSATEEVIKFNVPVNSIKNTLNNPSSLYTGNSGNGYLNAPNISLL
jgi:hypothetical protein